MPFVPLNLNSNALRLGLYIKIEGSWFSHPFPTNSFKIKTAQELKTIQGLTKVKLFFDPDRSDPEWGQSEQTEASVREPVQEAVEPDQETT